jgi:hypothetical protein
MKVVFICSPFQGKQENIERAKEYCRIAVERGCIPIAPTFISASSWTI